VGHLGPNPGMRRRGNRMIDLTISPKGLGAFLHNRTESSASGVEALI